MHRGIWFLLLLVACSIDRTITSASTADLKVLAEFQNLSAMHKTQIAGDEEPGEKLLLCLTIKRKEDLHVVSGQEVLLYHTSTSGEYQQSNPSDESTARLNGTATTDSFGRILVETILPGDYGSSSDNRHIHTTVLGASPVAYDIHFKQYTGFMGNRFIDGSDQHFLADLKELEDGTLVAFLTIEVKSVSF